MPMLFLFGALSVLAACALFVVWRQLDLRIRSLGTDRCLEERIEQMASEQDRLRSRIEALEAIATEES